jgi:hypothetical protein
MERATMQQHQTQTMGTEKKKRRKKTKKKR